MRVLPPEARTSRRIYCVPWFVSVRRGGMLVNSNGDSNSLEISNICRVRRHRPRGPRRRRHDRRSRDGKQEREQKMCRNPMRVRRLV